MNYLEFLSFFNNELIYIISEICLILTVITAKKRNSLFKKSRDTHVFRYQSNTRSGMLIREG